MAYLGTATTTSSTVLADTFMANNNSAYAVWVVIQNKGTNPLYVAPCSSSATTSDICLPTQNSSWTIPFSNVPSISFITTGGNSDYTIKLI